MKYYENYIVTNRLKKHCICGDVNLPYGTKCTTIYHGSEKAIVCELGMVCYVSSQTAFKYFSQNDDGCGEERGKLVNKILNRLASAKSKTKLNESIWKKIWVDNVCAKYKRPEYEDYWLWNYDFYNAPIDDLQYIAKLVGAK